MRASSSMSSSVLTSMTYDGIVGSPSSVAARILRSPDMSSYIPPAVLRTVTGWIMPFCFIDALSSSSACWSKSARGWNGFGLICEMAMWSILPSRLASAGGAAVPEGAGVEYSEADFPGLKG